jgi:hypothetical protein
MMRNADRSVYDPIEARTDDADPTETDQVDLMMRLVPVDGLQLKRVEMACRGVDSVGRTNRCVSRC